MPGSQHCNVDLVYVARAEKRMIHQLKGSSLGHVPCLGGVIQKLGQEFLGLSSC